MGYNTKKVSLNWWIDQIRAGEEFRKKYAMEAHWDTWRSYYRGIWATDVLPVNFFFMLLRAIVPRIYFKDPAVSVASTKPGVVNAIFAQLLERVDNKLFRAMKVKKVIKKMIHDAFLFGTASCKLGYGAQYAPTPGPDGTEAPVGVGWGRIEYMSGVMANMPWFARIPTGNLVVPSNCEDLDDAMWVANEIVRPIEDVKHDPRLKNTRDISPTRKRVVERSGQRYSLNEPIEVLHMYEIRDRKFGRCLIISPDSDKELYEGSDDLQTRGGFPIFSLVFNNDDEVFWGVPDAAILEPQQLEMNEIRTQMMKHRRVTLVKILVEEGIISQSEATKMLSESVAAIVQVKDINKVKPMQVAGIPPELLTVAEYIHADVRELIGFSRNQMGELQPKSGDTTATEASIVQMASEIRVDERRDIVGDMVKEMVTAMHEVLFKCWREEQVVDVIGPAGIPLWVAFSGEMLGGGAYEVSVDPESSLPQGRVAREQKAMLLYDRLKANPLIDPVQLTRYLLREMYGVQLDNLMKGLPTGAGLSQPMDLGQYAQVLGNAQRLGLPPGGQEGGG